MSTTQNPTETRAEEFGQETIIRRHPAYALMRFSRIQGHVTLFGSEIEHPSYIEMTVVPGEEVWRFSDRRFREAGNNARLIRVAMSHSQFAEAITTMNCGGGVPCTVEAQWRHREVPEGGEFPSIGRATTTAREQVREDVSAKAVKVTQSVNDLAAKIEGLGISKAAKAELLRACAKVNQELNDNLPFILSQYHEAIEKMTQQARTETEAFISGALMRAGLARLNAGDAAGGGAPAVEGEAPQA
jgi:hypothetical protein